LKRGQSVLRGCGSAQETRHAQPGVRHSGASGNPFWNAVHSTRQKWILDHLALRAVQNDGVGGGRAGQAAMSYAAAGGYLTDEDIFREVS
jgi:hypothetical protein